MPIAVPKTDKDYYELVERLIHQYPKLLTWKNSYTGEINVTGFSADPEWMPEIALTLKEIHEFCVDCDFNLPLFRDFKSKRGNLCVNYDGGSPAVEKLIDELEETISGRQ